MPPEPVQIDPNEPPGVSAEDVAALRERLVEAERLAALGTLAGLIAHEFNNLMTPVAGYAQAALRDPDDTELATKALGKARDGAQRASRIAGAILSMAREDGVQQPQDGDADPVEAFHVALACLAKDPESEGIRVEIDAGQAPAAAMAPEALQQVLLNLVLNARRAMLPVSKGGANQAGRGGVLRLSAAPADLAGASGGLSGSGLVIELSDTGCGMTAGECARIFDPFATGGAGSGLGLTLCKSFVERAGGRISVESEPGVGTTFRMELPAAGARRVAA